MKYPDMTAGRAVKTDSVTFGCCIKQVPNRIYLIAGCHHPSIPHRIPAGIEHFRCGSKGGSNCLQFLRRWFVFAAHELVDPLKRPPIKAAW